MIISADIFSLESARTSAWSAGVCGQLGPLLLQAYLFTLQHGRCSQEYGEIINMCLESRRGISMANMYRNIVSPGHFSTYFIGWLIPKHCARRTLRGGTLEQCALGNFFALLCFFILLCFVLEIWHVRMYYMCFRYSGLLGMNALHLNASEAIFHWEMHPKFDAAQRP